MSGLRRVAVLLGFFALCLYSGVIRFSFLDTADEHAHVHVGVIHEEVYNESAVLLGDAGYEDAFVKAFLADLSRCDPTRDIQQSSQKPFANVLLNIQFNTNSVNKLKTVNQYRAVLGKLFNEIVFTASYPGVTGKFTPPNQNASGDVWWDNEYGVLICPGSELGLMANECLSALTRRFPGRDGYLQMHFDVLPNWPAMVDLPQDRIWCQGRFYDRDYRPFCSRFSKDVNLAGEAVATFKWVWFEMENPLTGRNVGKDAIWTYLKSVPSWVQENYRAKCARAGECPDDKVTAPLFPGNQMGDILYIPKKHVEQFRLLSRLAWQANLMLEIAVTMILCGLPIHENGDLLQLLGVSHDGRPADWSTDYVFHQNPMWKPDGFVKLQKMVDAIDHHVSRANLPDFYGLYSTIPRP